MLFVHSKKCMNELETDKEAFWHWQNTLYLKTF